MHLPALLSTLMLLPCAAAADSTPADAVTTRTVAYQAGATTLKGYLALPAGPAAGPRPAVLVVPEWWGLNDYARRRTRELAQLGYVGFAVDMYGDGRTTTDPKQAAAWAGQIRSDRHLMLARIQAALDSVRKLSGEIPGEIPGVDPQRLAIIGYCFGGGVALETARSGADIRAVISFHGSLATQHPAQPGTLKASILVCNGAEDASVSPQAITDFTNEMRHAGADWEFIQFGQAVHAFTNPDADKVGLPNVRYNKLADARSWAAMKFFLAQTLR